MIGTVKIEAIAKTYIAKQRKGLFKAEKRPVEALKNINFCVEPGEIFGLLGPNGAGKTTLIKILTTLLLPTSGQAWVNGHSVLEAENQVRASVGCMLMGERGLYWKLTGRENLRYFGALYHLVAKESQRRSEAIIEMLDLGELANRTVETYSSGQRMKLAFAKALINDAPLLILDEPTNTLDVPSASELRGIVRMLNEQGKTIIYTTHIMSEAETLCDRVAIIDYGELLALGTVAELKASLGREHVIRVEGVIPHKGVEAVQALTGVDRASLTVNAGLGQLTVVAQTGDGLLPRVIEALSQARATIHKIAPEQVTLEDIFIAKTGRTLTEDTRAK